MQFVHRNARSFGAQRQGRLAVITPAVIQHLNGVGTRSQVYGAPGRFLFFTIDQESIIYRQPVSSPGPQFKKVGAGMVNLERSLVNNGEFTVRSNLVKPQFMGCSLCNHVGGSYYLIRSKFLVFIHTFFVIPVGEILKLERLIVIFLEPDISKGHRTVITLETEGALPDLIVADGTAGGVGQFDISMYQFSIQDYLLETGMGNFMATFIKPRCSE